MEGLASKVEEMLIAIQKALYDRAIQYRNEHTTEADTYAEFKEIMEGRPGAELLSVNGIGPNATLIFEVELISIEDKPQTVSAAR